MAKLEIELPRYVQAKRRADGWAFYWTVPDARRVIVDGKSWPETVSQRLSSNPIQMEREAAGLNQELDRLRAGTLAAGAAQAGTMPELIRLYEASENFERLKDKTKRSYRQLSGYVQSWSSSKAVKGQHPKVANLTTAKILEWLAGFKDRPSLRKHLGTYVGILLSHARRIDWIQHNPATDLGLPTAKRQKPIRVITIKQCLELVAKADEMGLPWLGTGILLHFDLGQRQGDILALRAPRDYRGGLFHIVQSKTDQPVTIEPFLDETKARLAKMPDIGLLVALSDGRGPGDDLYRKTFRRVADACGHHDLWEMEMRHSCVIFAEQAGSTPQEIATRTGHTLKSVITIVERYRYRDATVAAQGAEKLAAYRRKTGQ